MASHNLQYHTLRNLLVTIVKCDAVFQKLLIFRPVITPGSRTIGTELHVCKLPACLGVQINLFISLEIRRTRAQSRQKRVVAIYQYNRGLFDTIQNAELFLADILLRI